MSVSFFSHAILGVYLPEASLYHTVKSRGCGHPEVLGAKFCPECGAPVWREYEEDIGQVLEDGEYGLRRINTSDFEYQTTAGGVFGKVLTINGGTGLVDLPDQEEWENIRQHVCRTLSQHAMEPWGEFGLHFVRFVSS